MQRNNPRGAAEARFAAVFEHWGFIAAYARRRGARDPDALTGEVMAIAWRRLADVPTDDARPWLTATARNLLRNERRRPLREEFGEVEIAAQPEPDSELDAELEGALNRLSETDREAILLIAWEDLTPSQAAESLGISATAFRVRLHRARKRLADHLTTPYAQIGAHS